MESGKNISKRDYKWQLRNGWIPDQDYVFVSYSSRDWTKVYPCVMALRARGINVYIDIEFMENQSSSWLQNFQERLFRDSSCKGIVAFLSINYMRSYACLVEQMANRTNRMRKHAGRFLPMFYVALDPELRTPQQMASYIYDDEIRRESTAERVEISPPEYTLLQRFILDSSLNTYRDEDSVRELLDDIHDKHDVVINMYDLIFSNPKDMPNIQAFEGVEKCAQLLADNFLNDKNNSIKLTMLEDLKQETLKKMEQPAPQETPARETDISHPQEAPARETDISNSQGTSVKEPDIPNPQGTTAKEPDISNPQGTTAGKPDISNPQETTPANEPDTRPQENPVVEQLCRKCGAPLRPGKKFCSKCGTKISKRRLFL